MVGTPAKAFLIGGDRPCAEVPCAHRYFRPSSLDRMDGLPRELSTSRCGKKRWGLALPGSSRYLFDPSLAMDKASGCFGPSAIRIFVESRSSYLMTGSPPQRLLFQTKMRMNIPSFFLDFHIRASYIQQEKCIHVNPFTVQLFGSGPTDPRFGPHCLHPTTLAVGICNLVPFSGKMAELDVQCLAGRRSTS